MTINVSYLKPNPFPDTDLPLLEFQQSFLRWVLLIVGLPSILWQLFETTQLLLLFCLVMNILAAWLIGKHLYLAGMVLFFAISVYFIGLAAVDLTPSLTLMISFLPFIMGICFGLWGGGLSYLGMIAVMQVLGYFLPEAGLDETYWSIVLLGAVLLVFSLVIRYWMVSLINLYFEYYARAMTELGEARHQRVEMKQMQEDLTHTNTEMARLTKQLKVLNQVAEEARQAKENFVSMVSHELRTPLNMIIGFSEVITQTPAVYGSRLPPTLLADISSIQRNSQHLLELVNDVLDLSQVEMGNLAISREWCTIQGILLEAFEVIRPLFDSKGLYLKSVTQDLDPKQQQAIFCDKTRVREIIINLLSNAGRFTEQGGVTVGVKYENHQVIVSVQDTGPGISPENQVKLFEPFQQLDSSIRRRYGGSGLGLAISKRFVELHGGKMWLTSEVGRGTTFFFSLPISISETQGDFLPSTRWVNTYAIQEPRRRAFKGGFDTPKPRIIVLEEGQTIRHLIHRYLDDVEILSVSDIAQAIESVNQFPSQMMLINHPQATNLITNFAAQSQLPFGLPILAFWMPDGKDFADSIKANGYLVKPVGKDMLLDTIARYGDQIKRILLVDDNPEIIQLFGRILSSANRGFEILRASDGQQALELLRSRKPDMMILDLIMPEKNGFQVLEEKAGDEAIREIPVVVITAQDPAGLPKISQSVTLSREGGFSSRDLLELIKSLGGMDSSANLLANTKYQ